MALIYEGIRDCEMVRMMGVEERERSQRWNERVVLETRHLEGEIESLRTQLSDERRARPGQKSCRVENSDQWSGTDCW